MADEQRHVDQMDVSLDHALLLSSFLLAQLQLRRRRTTEEPIVLVVPDDVQYPETVFNDDAYRNSGFGAVPASGEAIATLPKTMVGETREKECAVCLEGFEQGDRLRKMPCSLSFHESCIFDWLRVSRLCPHCRFPLPAH